MDANSFNKRPVKGRSRTSSLTAAVNGVRLQESVENQQRSHPGLSLVLSVFNFEPLEPVSRGWGVSVNIFLNSERLKPEIQGYQSTVMTESSRGFDGKRRFPSEIFPRFASISGENIPGSHEMTREAEGQRSEHKKWIHCFENVTTIPAVGFPTVLLGMKEMRLELEDAKSASISQGLDILHHCISPNIVEFYGAFFQEGAV